MILDATRHVSVGFASMRETSKLSLIASRTVAAVPVADARAHVLALRITGVVLLIPGCGPPI
jgi:hypothetical protein